MFFAPQASTRFSVFGLPQDLHFASVLDPVTFVTAHLWHWGFRWKRMITFFLDGGGQGRKYRHPISEVVRQKLHVMVTHEVHDLAEQPR